MSNRSYIPALTGVRAIAAFLVFFHHNNRPQLSPFTQRLFTELHIGVSIFFVLSGFLICHRYFDNVSISRKWLAKYFRNRIARIYPIYFLLTVATFITAYILNDERLYRNFPNHSVLFLLNITLLKGFSYDINFSGISQAWSLTVEECFYLCAPLFFIAIKKDRKWLFFLPIVITLIGVGLTEIGSRIQFYGFFSNYRFLFLYSFPGRCWEFFMGMALALILRQRAAEVSYKYPICTTLGLTNISLSVLALTTFPISETMQNGTFYPWGIVINNLILPLNVALFFYGLVKEGSIFKRLLSTNIFVLLGKSSYTFYLIHIGIIGSLFGHNLDLFTSDLVQKNPGMGSVISQTHLQILLLFCSLNIASVILFKCVEEPLNDLIRKYFDRSKHDTHTRKAPE